MELIDERFHTAMSHKGPAAVPRAIRRATGGGGKVTGRALAAVTVYLTARDALQQAGVLQPDFAVLDDEEYRFVADDGSEFVVWPSGWFSSAKIEFVKGGRNGQTIAITDVQVEAYRRQAEARWGRYVPGGLFREPRFIPGTERSRLPLFREDYGVPQEVGWIDEQGVHYYSIPRPKVL